MESKLMQQTESRHPHLRIRPHFFFFGCLLFTANSTKILQEVMEVCLDRMLEDF
jgi:hypothetical protein